MKELILGGMRSGKSRLAEQHALAAGLPVTCIATAQHRTMKCMRALRTIRHSAPAIGSWWKNRCRWPRPCRI